MPERNESYKSHGRSEDLLEKYLPKFDPTIVGQMIQEFRAQIESIGRFTLNTEPNPFTIKEMNRQSAYWEIESHLLPVLQYIPECFRHITRNLRYNFKYRQFLECVPSYIPVLNHVTLLNIYNQGTSEFGNNAEGILNKFVHTGGKKMSISSLNNLLQYEHKKKYLSDAHDAVKMSFEFCYWNTPTYDLKEKSFVKNLIYHSHSKVQNILLPRKTIIKILKIYPEKLKRDIFHLTSKNHPKISILAGKTIGVKHAEVLVLCDDGIEQHCISKKMLVNLTEDVADSVQEEDIFNAVLVMGRMQDGKIGIPFVIGKIGKTIPLGDIKCVLALVMWKMLQTIEDDSSPTLVTSVQKASSQVQHMIQSNPEMFSSENFSSEMLGWTKNLPKKINNAIEEMFPMYQVDGNDIYQLSPVIMSYLASMEPEILQNKESLMLIMKLFAPTLTNQRDWGLQAKMKIRTSNTYSELQKSGSLQNDIIGRSQRIVNRIVYSRILSQHYTHW